MERRRLVATLALLALVALAGCEAAPVSDIVCAGCETMPNRTDNVTVDDSVTHVYVDSEGDARVEARMNLSGAGVEALRNDRGNVRELVESMEGGFYGRPAFERRNLTGRMDGDTLVVHGPDGTRSLVDPAKGTSDGDRVTWTGDEVTTRTYLVFGQNEALARLAIALETLSWAGWPAVWLALFMSLPLVGLAFAFASYYPERLDGDWSPTGDRLFGALCCLGVLFAGLLGGPWGYCWVSPS